MLQSGHPGVLLNDNRDGTFSEVGRHDNRDGKQDHRTVMVKSKNPLPSDAPTRAAPNASPHNLQAQIDLVASIANWEKIEATRAVATEPTVDETLALKIPSTAQPVMKDTESSDLSDAVTLSDHDTLEPELTSAEKTSTEDSDAGEAIEPADNETHGESPGVVNLTNPTARENWDTIQSLFKDKRFPPPQSGPLKELLLLHRVREIVLNPTATSKLSVHWPKDASLLIVQLAGRESPTTCGRCSKGYGIFSSCVVVPQDMANVLQSGVCACANCSWKSAYHKTCDLKKLLKNAGGVATPKGAALQGHIAKAGTAQIVEANSSDDRGSNRVQPLLSDGSEGEQHLRTRHSKRLKSNTVQDSAGAQSTGKATVPPAENTSIPAVATMRKMTHNTEVDGSFSFRVDVIAPKITLRLQPDVENLRICLLVMGKVAVKVRAEQNFDIGVQGMFRLLPGVDAEVINPTGIDAVLQISSFRGK